MSENGKQYDNSNDGIAYTCYGARGFCKIDNVSWTWRLLWGTVNEGSKAPPGEIILHQRAESGQAEKVRFIPLWPPTREGAKESLGGKTETHFVNVYVRDPNDPKSNDRTPDVRVKFKVRQQPGQGQAQQAPRQAPASAPRQAAPPPPPLDELPPDADLGEPPAGEAGDGEPFPFE